MYTETFGFSQFYSFIINQRYNMEISNPYVSFMHRFVISKTVFYQLQFSVDDDI